MKRIFKFLGSYLVIAGLLITQTANASSYLRAYAEDTIAGLGTDIVTENVNAFDQVYFEIITPSGQSVTSSSFADDAGKAELNLEASSMTDAGKYHVAVKTSENSLPGPLSTFTVYPDSPSMKFSTVEPSKKFAISNNSDEILIDIHLRDKYKNPIAFHELQLISKRGADTVVLHSRNSYTNEDGKITYGLRSDRPGKSELYVYDVTSKSFFPDPLSVEFYSNLKLARGGDDYSTFEPFDEFDSGDSFSILSLDEQQFVFPNFPAEVNKGEPFSFTVEVQDASEDLILDYEGTVHFSVPGAEIGDVVLPEDYTYTLEDQGSHTFPLTLQFQKEGTYKLIVQDVDNEEMLTEQIVSVGSGESSSAFADPSFSGIEVTQPAPGTYSNPSQVLQGKASPGLAVKLYDNDKEIASVNTDIKGTFTYTTSPLTEGEHTVYAVSISSDGAIVGVSEDVVFKIDGSAPSIVGVEFDPAIGANPGQSVTVKMIASEELSKVLLDFEGSSIVLTPSQDDARTYKGVLEAPAEFGSYPVNITLIDALGNQTSVDNAGSLIVGSGNSDAFVAAISQVEAHPSNERVTLIWEKPLSTLPIQHYRVYYGDSTDLMNHIVDTHDASTTWYIPKLKNGNEYFFAVTAVDEKGNESAQLSTTVSGKPFYTEPVQPIFEPFPEQVDPIIVTEAPEVQGETGPATWFLLLLSIAFGNFLFRRNKV